MSHRIVSWTRLVLEQNILCKFNFHRGDAEVAQRLRREERAHSSLRVSAQPPRLCGKTAVATERWIRQRLFVFSLILIAVSFLPGCAKHAAEPVGVWTGTIRTPSNEQIAFTLDVKREGDRIVGALVNGDERVLSTSGSLEGDVLQLRYDFYDGTLNAKIEGDSFKGSFRRQRGKEILTRELIAIRANPPVFDAAGAAAGSSPIKGEWVLNVGEGDKQRAWRAVFSEKDGVARGTIIPISGDWGEIAGTLKDGELRLNRFDGINARVFRAKLTPEGKLEGIVDLGGKAAPEKVLGERLDASNKASVASLPDPNNYTRMKNPTEPFRFSFPDLDGKTVSSTDERFKDKVVVVTVTGSWCPNCHDEAPVLQDFYQRYKNDGLEVVALGFEYTGDVARDREQLNIFSKRHGVTYPVLLAGTTEEGDAQRKMPQLQNFGAYPTTIYIGRDGLVKHIHAGFEGKATGERYTRLKAEMENSIKEMLDVQLKAMATQ
jgi:thiol-disulfide isomerase/thioredoxin